MRDRIRDHAQEIDWLEIVTDGFLDDPDGLRELRRLNEVFPIVPHSLEMSVGSVEPLDDDYLRGVAAVADAVDAPWVSDHLCFTRENGIELGSLAPVQRTRQNARRIAERAQRIQELLGRRLLLENITYYLDLPGELTEAEMIAEVMRHCDCGILLDLNNLAINARNHGFDPVEFLAALPLDRVEQVHLAGSVPVGDPDLQQIDTHDAQVSAEVLELLAHLLDRQPVKGILLERDDGFPDDFEEIVRDLRQAREIMLSGSPR
ncbi:DUF692 domain-containing protein [Plantactinospora mayteni]|uniref:DUF692 domain-containing protein n=1 Tax=Plantactinospora mayteni TaxID=566021 RepID=UPI001940BF5F|nr:DUF692 domain-containing protein [Plantactinospora mayteni]